MSTLKCKAHWLLCLWVWEVEVKTCVEGKPLGKGSKRQSGRWRGSEKEQEELLVTQIRSTSWTQAAPFYLLFIVFFWVWREDTGKFRLDKQHNWCFENCNTKFVWHDEWWVHINKLFFRKTMRGVLLTFQRCHSDVSTATWNNHPKDSAQHRTNRWSIRCGLGTGWSALPPL